MGRGREEGREEKGRQKRAPILTYAVRAITEPTPRRGIRRAVLLVLPVLYVAGAAVYAGEAPTGAWLAVAAGVAVALLGARAPAELPRAELRARLVTTEALAFSLATCALSQRHGWAVTVREALALAASLEAIAAIAAIPGDPGLAPRATDALGAASFGPRAIARAGAGLVLATWGSIVLVDALAATGLAPSMQEVAPLGAAALGAVALVFVGAVALFTAGARRLELTAPPRALSCGAACAVGLVLAIVLATGDGLRADTAVTVGASLSAAAVVRLARVRDPLRLARRGRRLLTLALFGAPVVVLASTSAGARFPGPLGAFVIAAVAIAVGSLARHLEEPLLPVKGIWLNALAEAAPAARDRDAHEAIARVLLTLREAAGREAPSPELWVLHPTRVYTVDAAGYLREREAEIPPALIEVAQGEPLATVRVDVLSALEVRRPDLRSLLKWLEDRGALFATLIAGGDEPDGVLIVPAGSRSEPLTLEEVHAAKLLADAFVAVCQARSARERHLARERDLSARATALEDELAVLKHGATLDSSRNELASARLARPATVGITSATSRMAYDALERRVESSAPVVLVAGAGTDPVPYVARAHLEGPRRSAPLVVVDGTSSREHDPARWTDPATSPLALADRGLLLLVDGAALPRDIQVLVARALAERRPPWERATPLDVAVALTATTPPDALVDEGRLAPELYARFEDATPITLPGLDERSEDLFSIVADRLAREGLRVRGKPVGIDAAAFARLVEHPFEGGDAELAAIVSRLVAHLQGDVVRAADMDALGLTRAQPRYGADGPRAGSGTGPSTLPDFTRE